MREQGRPPRVVISSSYGTPNVGDEAILTATIEALRERVPGIETTVLSLFPEDSRRRHPGTTVVESGVARGLFRTWQAIARADLLLVGGGGILQDASSLGNLLFHLSRAGMAILSRTPFVGCGVGVGPLRSPFGRTLSRMVLDRAAWLLVRDARSVRVLEEIGVDPARTRLTADLALLLRPEPAEAGPRAEAAQVGGPVETPKSAGSADSAEHESVWVRKVQAVRERGGPVIGLSLRPERGRHRPGATRTPEYQRILDSIARAAAGILEMSEAAIVFISMHPEQDDPIGEEIGARLAAPERFLLVPGSLCPKATLRTIGRLDAVLGMRLHSVVFAACSRVPFLALAYDPKVTGFCERLGLEEQVIAVEALTPETLLGAVRRTLEGGGRIRAALDERLPDLRGQAARNLDVVVDLLGVGDSSIHG